MEYTIKRYLIKSHKISQPVRLAVLADFHSNYGKPGWENLPDAVRFVKPDMVLLCGDIIDDIAPARPSVRLMSELARGFPCFYVSGNHEVRSGELDKIKGVVRRCGVGVLDGVPRTVGGISFLGADDMLVGREEFRRQVIGAYRAKPKNTFSVFLLHRPETAVLCDRFGFDLMVSGHAHGGQFRLPGRQNGLYSVGQGIFPKFSGGQFKLDNGLLVVSRGLTSTSRGIPRLFNPPELAVVDLAPE